MKNKIYLIIFLAALFLASCNKWIAPQYTNTEDIYSLREGMSVKDVSRKLNIEPYDVHYLIDDHMILEYNYRIKKRSMNISGDHNKKDAAHNESSQTAGEIWYDDPSVVYVHFEDGKMISYITQQGVKDGEFLMLDQNNISVITKDELIDLQKTSGSIIILNADDTGMSRINVPDENPKSIILPIH